MTRIPVPSLDPRRYAETFAVFVDHSLEYPQMLDTLLSVTRNRLRDGFRLLDIGAGTGQVIQSYLQNGGVRPACMWRSNPIPGIWNSLPAPSPDWVWNMPSMPSHFGWIPR